MWGEGRRRGQLGLGGGASLLKTVQPEEWGSKWRKAKGRLGRDACGQVRAMGEGSAGWIKARLRVSAARGLTPRMSHQRILAWGPESHLGKLVASTESNTQMGRDQLEDGGAGSVQVALPLLICMMGPCGLRTHLPLGPLPAQPTSPLCPFLCVCVLLLGNRPDMDAAEPWLVALCGPGNQGPTGQLFSLPHDVTVLRWEDTHGRG